MPLIPSSLLSVEHLPPPGATWEEIEDFAGTLHGASHFVDDAAVAQKVRSLHGAKLLHLATMAELRNFVAFMRRAVRDQSEVDREQLRAVHDVIEVLRSRLRTPLASATQDALLVDPIETELPVIWFGAMLDGIVDQADLLAPLFCRVSAEPTVVAAACRGLLRVLTPRNEWNVLLENKKRDLVVRRGDGDDAPEWVFEWKMFWENGFGENVRGVTKDLEKVRILHRGVAIACVFAVHDAPAKRFLTKSPLEKTVRRAIDAIGPVLLSSREQTICGDGVVASFQLLAWQ